MKTKTFSFSCVTNGKTEVITASVSVYETICKLYKCYKELGIIESYSIPVIK